MMCRRPAQCVDHDARPETCRLCKPRHLLRKRDRLPAIDPAEALRVNLWGAKHALAAADAAASPLERHLNRQLAIAQLGLALRRLPLEARKQLFQKDAPE